MYWELLYKTRILQRSPLYYPFRRRAYNDLLIAAIAKSTDIPPEHVMVNCSHTHSAPITVPWGPWEQAKDRPFHKFLPERLAKAARQACDRLQPVRLIYGREPTQIRFNRGKLHGDCVVMAPDPHGAVVPWVDVLSAKSLDGVRKAVLFSHAAHPVVVHNTSRLIGGDYPGFAVRHLQESYEEKCVFLFAQGCSGNVNAFPLRGGTEAAAAVGRDLGQAVKRALDRGGVEATGKLKASSCELILPLADPPPVAELQQIIADIEDAAKRARREALLAIAKSGRPQTMRLRPRSPKASTVRTFSQFSMWAAAVVPPGSYIRSWIFVPRRRAGLARSW